jgi:signal transduction histidine kinase
MSDDRTSSSTEEDSLATLGRYAVVVGGDGRLLQWDARFAGAVGRSDAALDGMPLSSVFDGHEVDATVERALERGTAAAEVKFTDETERYHLRLVAVGGGEGDGQLVGVLDERRRAIEPNTQSLDRMTDAFFALDEDWQITYVNDHARPTVADALGLDHDAVLVGRDFRELISDAVHTRLYEKYHEAIEANESITFEAEHESMESVFEVRAYPSDGGLSVYLREVTGERRRRETLAERERVLRGMYNITNDVERDFEAQVGGLIELVQSVLDASYGVLSEIVGDEYVFRVVRSPDDGIEPGTRVPLSATVCERTAVERRSVVLGDVVHDAPEVAAKDEDASWEWSFRVNCYIGAPVIVDGDVYGTFCFYDEEVREDGFSEWETTLVDITAQWVSYELTRRRVSERLRRQNERLEEFVSVVSHDLRNPLETLSGHLEYAERTGDEEHFDWCHRAIDRMDALIDDLLALARAGETVGETDPVELATLVRQCWNLVDTGEAALVVETDRTVEADRSRLRQLFENLARNAVEHGTTGSQTQSGNAPEDAEPGVTVTVGDTEEGFYFEDDGPGIPAEKREQVFDAGFSTAEDGTGFGLKIVESVAEAHGWSVTLAESDDGGARVEFTL